MYTVLEGIARGARFIALVAPFSTPYRFRYLDNCWMLEYEFMTRPKWLPARQREWRCGMELRFVKVAVVTIGLALFAANVLFDAKGTS